ncbi:MAG TPA: hypothetical protein VMU85_04740 [Stellaceae bacterium]|nr:hypothetical protein [Stellaceae bacterium]
MTPLRTPWWVLVVVAAALMSAHLTAMGLTWASPAPILLVVFLSGATFARLWKTPGTPPLIGLAIALLVVFAVEAILGVLAVRLGPLYPPERAPSEVERLIAEGLGRLYALGGENYVSAIVLIVTVLAAAVLRLVLRRRRTRRQFMGLTEHVLALLEVAGSCLAVLQLLTFGNAIDFKTTGLNAFAARYAGEVERIGSNQALLDLLDREVANLTAAEKALADRPPSQQAQDLTASTADLVAALQAMDTAARAASVVEETAYDPHAAAAADAATLPETPEPEPPRHAPDTRPVERFVSEIGKLTEVQQEAERNAAASARLAEQRKALVAHLAGSLRVSLKALTDAHPEAGGLVEETADRIARLVAAEGIEAATRIIRERTQALRASLADRQQALEQRRQDKTRYRDELEAYRTQQKTCFDITTAAVEFLEKDPEGQALTKKLEDPATAEKLVAAGDRRPPALLQRPQWKTGTGDANNRLDRAMDDEILKQLYNGSGLPPAAAEGYAAQLGASFRKSGGNIESGGFRLLADWVADACANGVPPLAFIDFLRGQNQRI